MATQQFESAKKLILHFTQKNSMNTETDIKGVMPGECRPWERRSCPGLSGRAVPCC